MSEQLPLRASAPAKINLGLFLGPPRAQDHRHELASVVQAISLADELTLELGEEGQGADEVRCPGLALADGEQNLAGSALRLFREATGWDARPLRLTIAKRVPVAAGLGGGSADAAAALRLASAASSLGSHALLLELASRLGADVPAQLAPGRWLAAGAGERLRELPPPSHPFGVLVLPAATGLSTAAVYAQADELGIPRSPAALRDIIEDLRGAFELGAAAPARRELLHNDLQAAAIALCPEIERPLEQALDAGADAAFVSGSGPTVVGLFLRANGPGRAERAVAGLAGREPAPLCATSLDARLTAIDSAVRNNHDR
jgi:4-diphosphocytidyl-2-C-methyl-D-erythritol kinase